MQASIIEADDPGLNDYACNIGNATKWKEMPGISGQWSGVRGQLRNNSPDHASCETHLE
jgi:hypothetical protein